MECIYFKSKGCHVGIVGVSLRVEYAPTEEETKELCETADFTNCARYKAQLERKG